MKSVPLKDLKNHLASFAEMASRGESILVTKHNKPYVRLSGAAEPDVRVGSSFETARLKPCLKNAKTRGRYLRYLLEDRDDDA